MRLSTEQIADLVARSRFTWLTDLPRFDGDPSPMHYTEVLLGLVLPLLTNKGPQLHQVVYPAHLLSVLSNVKDQISAIKGATIPEIIVLTLLASKNSFEEAVLFELVERRALVKSVDDDRQQCYAINRPFVF